MSVISWESKSIIQGQTVNIHWCQFWWLFTAVGNTFQQWDSNLWVITPCHCFSSYVNNGVINLLCIPLSLLARRQTYRNRIQLITFLLKILDSLHVFGVRDVPFCFPYSWLMRLWARFTYLSSDFYKLPDFLLWQWCVVVFSYLDLLNLMTYDLRGPWEDELGHQAAMYSSLDEPVAERVLNVVCVSAIHYYEI